MRVLLAAVGTRGDVQPALALALELRRLRHAVRPTTPVMPFSHRDLWSTAHVRTQLANSNDPNECGRLFAAPAAFYFLGSGGGGGVSLSASVDDAPLRAVPIT